MESGQKSAIAAVFRDPIPSTIGWETIEGLLLSIGCRIIDGDGPRVRFVKDGIVAIFERPPPGKRVKRYQIRALREYLESLGVTP
jgi:hypothetical protein